MPGFIKKIDHIAVVVDDISQALTFWQDTLGMQLSHMEDVPSEGSLVAFLPTGESEVELVQPTGQDNGVARFLKKHGPGMHHICFEVYDIQKTMAHLKEKQVRLINSEPIIGTGGKKIAFIHPESSYGVLVELYELSGKESEIRLDRARELAERVLSEGQTMANAAMEFLRNLREELGKDRRN
ncbi:MAG: methylmalonyl-CoA epimerase [Anaerolineales bacterium]|nr:methylmalonyl-CoA epimerase [Anaerolineales bacterium]MCW5856551.1 methylmalonyl-CoA epimerase [Anaerolineales bacterium]